MPKMIDLGHIDTDDAVSPRRSRKKRFPSVWLDAGIALPLSPEDVGKDFDISGKIHVTGIDENTTEHGNKKEFRFELRAMQIHNSRNRLKVAVKKNARTNA